GAGLSYQWQKDGVDLTDGGVISGATTSILTLTGVAEANEGAYRCVVTGTCNVVNTNPANLTVNPTTNITTQPVSITRCENESAGFSVVASGTGNTFQWKKDGVDLTDNANISGATTANLTIASVSTADAGAYTCQVNSEFTVAAVLTVNENVVISSQPVNKTACSGDDIIFNVVASGTSLSYQWQKDAVDIVGETSSGLLLNNVTAANEGIYKCIITGLCGSVTSAEATLAVDDNVSITLQPVDEVACEGSATGFTINATGTSLSYQWKKNGVDLTDNAVVSGATTNSLAIDPVDDTYNDVFTCQVTGACDVENSNPANLTVRQLTTITSQPVNITACNGENATFTVVASATNISYQWQKDGVDIAGQTSDILTLNAVDDTDEATYRCQITGNCSVEFSDGATLTVDDIVNITTQPAANPTLCEGDNLSLTVIADGAGLTYQWQKDGINLVNGGTLAGATSDNLIITGTTVSDDGIYTCIVTGSCGSDNSTLSDVVINPTTSITTHPVSYTIVEGGDATFTTVANGAGLSYQWQKDGVDLTDGGVISGATTSILTLTGVAEANEGAYRCVVT
ncbi:MAG: immunoglobulin domain-containing protein, partial [Bacteroidales bacterium]|nr:immunoglobulin domain-containing protein [Bacteroidales bacterium]